MRCNESEGSVLSPVDLDRMETFSVNITIAAPEQEPAVKDLLERCELPYADIARHIRHFQVASVGDRVVGVIGIEMYPPAALVRSLAVSQGCRGHGLARLLYDRAESYARAQGVNALYLLTLTAPGFFTKLGFSEIDRTVVPTEIKRTPEFAVICPATATCMLKRLTAHLE